MRLAVALALGVILTVWVLGYPRAWPIGFLRHRWPGVAWDQGSVFIYALLGMAGLVVALILLYIIQAP